MRNVTRITILILAIITLTPQVLGQSPSDDVLQSLLSEVRALRLTLQKSSLLSLRGDLLVERIRTAQSRETTTRNQVDSFRRQIGSLEQERQRFLTRKEELDEKIRREYDPELVESLKQEFGQYDNAIEMFGQQIESARRSESELLSRLDEDRASLDALEAQFDDLLNEIERALEPE